MSVSRVRIDIDRLVLQGFAPHDSAAIAAALQEHLRILIQDRGIPTALQRSERLAALPTPHISATAAADPAATGREIAGAVFASLHGETA